MKMHTNLGALANLLNQSNQVVLDVETSGLSPHQHILAGAGFLVPGCGEGCYINIHHSVYHPDFPKATEQEFAAVISPFFADPSHQVIGHNVGFDLQFLFQLGIPVQCQTIDTLIMSHRVDENLRMKATDCTRHRYSKVGYGLKKLVRIFFNEVPPTIMQATEGKNCIMASPLNVSRYCVGGDCRNTWRLYQRNLQLMDDAAKNLFDTIDCPNTLVIAKMLWHGMGVDKAEASHQIEECEQAAHLCREELWDALGDPHRPLFSKTKDLRQLLSNLMGFRVHSMTAETLQLYVKSSNATERQRRVLANLMIRKRMKQRVSTFLKPLPNKAIDGRIYPERFSSTLVTTRFSCKPNLQNMPKKADKVSDEDDWINLVPEECRPLHKTRNIITAAPGNVLIELDYSAAEPRYLASVFQRAITEKGTWYRGQCRMLRMARESKYGQLMQRMRETRTDKVYVPNNIVWPTYQEDPLWRVFKYGIPVSDPYNALLMTICNDTYLAKQSEGADVLEQWFKDERWRGKRAWLALAYGSKAASLASKLKWTVERTQEAIDALENTYEMLPAMRELTLRSVLHLGKVKTLWGRMRRLNGFYQLAGTEPVRIRFHYVGERNKHTGKSTFQRYEANVVPLGSWRRGVQAFVQDCWYVGNKMLPEVSVLRATPDGQISHIDTLDYFVQRPHFNNPPFRNIPFSRIEWVQEANGLIHYLGRQEHAERQAFNFLAQGCGADHLRTTMNAIDAEVCVLDEFQDCHLIMSIHDSLIYETPQEKAQSFIAAITPVARRRPVWCDFDIEISVEVGRRMGELKPV